MDRDRLTEPSIPEIWFEPADPRRLGVLLRRMIGALACTVAVVSVLLVLTLSNRIADSERFEDRQLAAALARVPADTRSELAAAAGREAMLVDIPDKDGVLTEVELTIIVAREVPDALTQRWLDTVALRAARGNTEWFESVGPSDQVWWHTTAPIS